MIVGYVSPTGLKMMRLRFEVSSITNKIESLKQDGTKEANKKVALLNIKLFAKKIEMQCISKIISLKENVSKRSLN